MGNLSRRAAGRARKIGRTGLSAFMPAAGALILAAGLSGDSAEAKTPGKSYCFYGKCHRVKTIAETEAMIGKDEIVHASHYDSCKRDRYNPCGLTSSGAVFDSEAPDNAASPILPDGTTVLVRSLETGVALVLRINNAGPYWGNRKLDVSRKAAEVLGFAGQGVAKLEMRVIDAPTVAEATYKKKRVYDPVPGHIGQFASLDEAQSGAATAYVVAGLSSPFASETGLGAGNPTRVAGASGTQSGTAIEVPTVLAAAASRPSPEIAPVAAPPAVAPVRVAALVATTEVADVTTDAQADAEAKPVKTRSHAERSTPRNSRSYRVAKRHQNGSARKKAVAVVAQRKPESVTGSKIVTNDGTNDMSMFSRHVYAGKERLASQEPIRRRAALGFGGNEG
jgi:rare lipoprotein A